MVRTADWSHETVLAAEPGSAAVAREFICIHLAAHGLQGLIEDARMVVSELATNAVKHARTPFTLTLSSSNGLVRVGVADTATSFPIRYVADDMDVSGRGLLIVEMLTADWGTSTDSHGLKTVWASFSL